MERQLARIQALLAERDRLAQEISSDLNTIQTAVHQVNTGVLYHGTSSLCNCFISDDPEENAMQILKTGFRPSQNGLLGYGIYLGPEEKAEGFARHAEARGHGSGAVVLKCSFTTNNCLIALSAEGENWQAQGYDAYWVGSTSRSTKAEICVKSTSQVRVLGWRHAWESHYHN